MVHIYHAYTDESRLSDKVSQYQEGPNKVSNAHSYLLSMGVQFGD